MNRPPYLLLTVAFILVSASSASASVFTLTPRISVNEEYTDNVDSADSNATANSVTLNNNRKREEYITTISPGFSASALEKHSGAQIDYTATYAMYQKNTENDTLRHNAGLSFWSDLSKHTRFQIRDNFLRTEESSRTDVFGTPLPQDSILVPDTTARRGRSPYITNATSASLSHQFGEKDTVSCSYLYSFRKDDAQNGNDNQRHAPTVALSYWLTPQFGIDTSAAYTRGEFDNSEDFDDWVGSVRLNRMLTKQLSIYTAYRHTIRRFAEEETSTRNQPDYEIYEPSVGFSYQFSKDMSASIGGGYFKQEIEEGETKTGYTLNADINKSWVFRRGSIRVAGSAGLDRNEFGTENIGLERFYGLSCSTTYALTKRLSSSLSGYYRRNEPINKTTNNIGAPPNTLLPNGNETTNNVRAGLGFNYTITPWPYLHTDYYHNLLRSDVEGRDYDENVVTIGITAVPERPFRWVN